MQKKNILYSKKSSVHTYHTISLRYMQTLVNEELDIWRIIVYTLQYTIDCWLYFIIGNKLQKGVYPKSHKEML